MQEIIAVVQVKGGEIGAAKSDWEAISLLFLSQQKQFCFCMRHQNG
jgi:hypothetical protein